MIKKKVKVLCEEHVAESNLLSLKPTETKIKTITPQLEANVIIVTTETAMDYV